MQVRGRWSGHASQRARQLAILRGAGQVFAETGYDYAGMDAIALAAGVSKVTVYAHFHDKARLFEAVMDYWLNELPTPALTVAPDSGLREQLSVVVRELRHQVEHPAERAITRTLERSVLAPPSALSKRWEQRHLPYQRYLEAVLAHRCRCESPALAARQFLLLVLGSLKTPPDADDEAMAALDVFLRAYPECHGTAG